VAYDHSTQGLWRSRNYNFEAEGVYTNYSLEDDLLEMAGISLVPKRKHNLKRQHSGPLEYILSQTRNYIETVSSSIVNKMPRYIKARTERGFYLKVFLFIMAYLFCRCLPIG